MTDLPGLRDGDFDHHDPDFIANPWPTYQHLRQECPVGHSDRYGGYWYATRYDDIVDIAADHETFTSTVVGSLLIPGGIQRSFAFLPLEYDPPEHTLYRELVAPVFNPGRVNQFTPDIRELADRLLEPLVEAGGGDMATDFAAPLTTGALALFIGLPDQDRSRWVDLVRRSFEGSVRDPEDAARAGAEFKDYIDELIRSRRADRVDDLISMLLDAEIDGHTLDDDQIRGFIMLVLVAGHETTASSLSYSLRHLSTHPDDLEYLRTNHTKLPAAIEEFIRLSSPVSIFARNATTDVNFRDASIRQGDVVGLSFSSANRDESHFPDPETCKLDRRPNRHLAFGSGVHFCLGAQMARRELTVALEAILERGLMMNPHPTDEMSWKGRGDALSIAHLPISIDKRR